MGAKFWLDGGYDRIKVLGDYRRTDRLWLVIPLWDEGEDWEPAEGIASLVIAPTREMAEKSLPGVGWTRVYEMPDRGSFDG